MRINDARDVVYLIFMVLIFGTVAYFIVELSSAAAEILAAIIGAVGAIVVSVFAYIFQLRTNNKQHLLQSEANRKQNLILAKQANYQQVLRNVGQWIRDRKDPNAIDSRDALYNSYSQTWVFGDKDVVKCTVEFMKDPNKNNYIELLSAMRRDIGLPEIDADIRQKVKFYEPETITIKEERNVSKDVSGIT